jgi:NADH-quinone oxidoreductase chain G
MKIFINNFEIECPSNITVLEACSMIGIHLPRFCYHQELSIAGNCRMCLVEIEKSPKPIAACTLPISSMMKIFTDTPLVKKAREGVLELLLLNHPLDCPICDQGGECDLQEHVLNYGSDRSRFFETKRTVEDKNCGPLIKTIMTRCIHCTRCVRFVKEIAEIPILGTTNRGQDTEIGTFIEKSILSELSGNLIDLCPVGALTSKSYAFKSRPWEIDSVDSIDIFDSVSSKIRIDIKDFEIMRILPNSSHQTTQWITDKIRFSYDGLKQQRLIQPLCKFSNENSWIPISWKNFIYNFRNQRVLNNSAKSCIVISNTLDVETLVAVKMFASQSGIKNLFIDRELTTDFSFLHNYNLTLNSLENTDCCLLIDTNPKIEASLLNLKLQQQLIKKNGHLYNVGVTQTLLNYPIYNIGSNFNQWIKFLEGKHKICQNFKKAKFPIIFYGSSILERIDTSNFFNTLQKFNSTLKIFDQTSIGLLNSESNQVGAFNLGISSFNSDSVTSFNSIDHFYFIEPRKEFLNYFNNLLIYNIEQRYTYHIEECLSHCDFSNYYYLIKNPVDYFKDPTLVVYQSSHFPYIDFFTELKSLVGYLIPLKTFIEQEGTYFNLSNEQQKISKVFNSKLYNLQNKENWQISCMLMIIQKFGIFNTNFCFDFLQDKLKNYIPTLSFINYYSSCIYSNFYQLKVSKTLLKPYFVNFYHTHPINYYSSLMGNCSLLVNKLTKNFQ